MNQARLIGLLLSPSLFSTSIAVLLTTAILGIATWSYITPDNPLHSYFFGPYGLTTVFQNSTNGLSAINGLFGNPATYNIAVLVFALFVGLIVYVFLHGVNVITDKAKTEVNEVAYVTNTIYEQNMRKEARTRLGLRLAALVAWIIYIVFFGRVVVPFCILLGRVNSGNLWEWDNLWHGAVAFLTLLIAFHVHAVFMRLLVLRPRFFGMTGVVPSDGGH
jgi:uncharacterized membrane protein YhdT